MTSVNVHFHISSFSVDARLMDLALLTRHIGIPTAVSPWIKAEGGCGNLSLKKGQQPAGIGHRLDQGSIGWDSGVSLKGFAVYIYVYIYIMYIYIYICVISILFCILSVIHDMGIPF